MKAEYILYVFLTINKEFFFSKHIYQQNGESSFAINKRKINPENNMSL